MGVIDEVLEANEIYSRTHELRRLTPRPARQLAILTCMDTRLSIRTLGLSTGDAHIIRNAGGIVTDDSLRSLLISHYLLDTEEFMVINHTDCGLMHTSEQDLTHANREPHRNRSHRSRILLCLSEYRGERAPPATETAYPSLDAERGFGAGICLRREQRPPARNQVGLSGLGLSESDLFLRKMLCRGEVQRSFVGSRSRASDSAASG